MVEMKMKALGLDSLFQGIGLAYVVVFLVVLAVVLANSKTSKAKGIRGALVTFVFAVIPYWLFIYKSPAEKNAIDARAAKQAEWQQRYAKGKALFDEKCKTAGERIYKTVDNVEGVLLLKIREQGIKNRHKDLADPMWPDAALAGDHFNEDQYVKTLLLDREIRKSASTSSPKEERLITNDVGGQGERGLRFVDIIEAETGKRYRVTASSTRVSSHINNTITLQRRETTEPQPRYVINFENNVDPSLRKYWVAGTTVKVIDTKNSETLGEFEAWRFDRSQGNTSQSSPWTTSAIACPGPVGGTYVKQTHYFVEKILKARQGN